MADDQVTSDFLAGRALAQRGNPAQELDALLPSSAAKPAAKPPAGAAAAAKPAAAEAETSAPPGAAAGGRPAMPSATDAMLPIGLKIIGAVPRVAKDLAVGAMDAPRQLLGGVLDYGNNLMRFADDVVKKAEAAGMPNAYFRLLDKDGNFSPKIQSAEEFRAAKDAGEDDVFQIPTTGASDAVTGNIVRAGTTFLLGRNATIAGAGGAKAAGVGGNRLADFLSGATGGVDPESRISNVIDKVAPNFVSEWLKAKPGEEEDALVGRLKSGFEMAGMGALFTGARAALWWLRGTAKEAPDIAKLGEGPAPAKAGGQAAAAEGAGEASAEAGSEGAAAGGEGAGAAAPAARDVLRLGDPLEPAVARPAVTSQTVREGETFLEGAGGDNPIKLNLARIGSGDDIAMTLRQVSSMLPKGAPQSNEATVALADSLGMTPEQLVAGYQGSGLNAAETTAMRFMLDSSASQLEGFARQALDPATASPEAKATFMKAFATHRALQQYAENMRAEAGRTLQSWSIMSRERSEMGKAISDLVQRADGEGDLTKLAQAVVDLAGDPTKVSAFVGQSSRLPGRDALLYGFYNTLLSYKTVGKKALSDTAMMLWNVATRATAENFGASGGVAAGEAAQLAYGYIGSLKDGFRAAGKALMAGESRFMAEQQSMDALRSSRLSMLANGAPDALPVTQPSNTGWAYLRAALPTSWIGGVDDMAKVMNYRAELRALAWREGTKAGKTGEELADHVAQALDAPGVAMHTQATDAALRTTFQEPLTGIADTIMQLRDKINIPIRDTGYSIPLGRVLMPFVKIPANIISTAYRNSPLALAAPSSALRAELAAGGATRDLAMARIWLGSAVALTASDLALLGYVTGRGPSDPNLNRAWQEAGNQPYSIQIPGQRPIGYRGVEPFGLMIGTVADTFNTMKFARDPDRESMAASFVFGAGHAMLSASYLQSAADFLDAMGQPDVKSTHYVDRLLATLTVPNAVAGGAAALDPWLRQHYGYLDAVEARLPYISQGLPPAVTLWGDPIPLKDAFLPPFSDTGLARMLSPLPLGMKPENVEPIDSWIWENRAAFPHGDDQKLGISKPGIVQSFSGGPGVATQVELTPPQHYRLQVLAGNELKDPATKLGAKDYLNALIAGSNPDRSAQKQWDSGSPEARALIVQSVVNKFRSGARSQLRQEFPDVEDAVQAGLGARAAAVKGGPASASGARGPTLQGGALQ